MFESTKLDIGHLVIVKGKFRNQKVENSTAYVYAVSEDTVSILTENGEDLGVFSKEEQDENLVLIGKSPYEISFTDKKIVDVVCENKELLEPIFSNLTQAADDNIVLELATKITKLLNEKYVDHIAQVQEVKPANEVVTDDSTSIS